MIIRIVILFTVSSFCLTCNLTQEGTTQELSSEKSFSSYRFERVRQTVTSSSPGITTVLAVDATGTISGNAITLSVPTGTNVTGLIATYAHSGFSAQIGSTHQVSSTTANNFTTSQTYTVFAEDVTSQNYTVTVNTFAPGATAPEAYNVSIAGIPNESMTLKGVYYYGDVNGNAETTSTYRWLRASSANGTFTATGTTTQTYATGAGDVGMYLKFEVTPVNGTAPTTGTAVTSSAIGPIGSGLPVCNITINEWADAGSNVDYIELKNLSSSSAIITNNNVRIQYGAGQGTTVTAATYLENNISAVASAVTTTNGVVLAAGEIVLFVDSDVGDANITTIRGYNSFTGRIFIGSETTTIGSNDRLDDNFAQLFDGTNTWSITPNPTNFGSQVGTSTYSSLKSTFNCSSDALTDTSKWQNASTTNRTAGTENPASL